MITTLALIGKGRWGQNYLKEVKKISNVRIKYVVTHNYNKLLKYNDIDGIIIATPAETHFEIISNFPNKYLLVEKPLSTSFTEAKKIINNKIMIGHTYLFNKTMIHKINECGKIKKFNFTLHNTDSYGSNVGPIWELAPHPLSVFMKISRGDIRIIRAKIDKGNLSAKLSTPYCVANFSVGWNYADKKREFEFVGTKKTIILDGTEYNEISPLANQIKSFVEFVHGGKNNSTLKDGIKIVKYLGLIEKICMM